jgi:hypothetical protein
VGISRSSRVISCGVEAVVASDSNAENDAKDDDNGAVHVGLQGF